MSLHKLRVFWPNALLALIAVYATMQVVEDVATARVLPAAPAKLPLQRVELFAGARHPRAYYDIITKRDVFNLPLESGIAAQAPTATTDLPIILVGVSHLSNAKPFIIVQDKANQQQSLFRLGEAIDDAGIVVAVESDRAVLDHLGQRIVLAMPKDFASSTAVAAAGKPLGTPFQDRLEKRRQAMNDKGGYEGYLTKRREEHRALLEKVRQERRNRILQRAGGGTATEP
jgi:hypothetical protein